MNNVLQVSSFVFLLAATGFSETLYLRDFSEPQNPPRYRATTGSTLFHNSWTIASSKLAVADDWAARYEINITTTPPDAHTSWHGGFFHLVEDVTELPSEWQLTFDFYLEVPGLVRASLKVSDKEWPLPIGEPSEPRPSVLNYWIPHAGGGWQSLRWDSSAQPVVTESSFADIGTDIRIGLPSHDQYGGHLPAFEIGQHVFLLDNVRYESVPEPSAGFLSGVAALLVARSRVRRR